MGRIRRIVAGLVALVSGIAATAQTASNNSLLWQISGGRLKKPSYLFGTIHLVCPADYFWTKAMNSALDKSDKVCLEMDMDDNDVLMAAASGMAETSGKKLSEYFTTEQYAALSNYVRDSMGMNIRLFEGMKPMILQTLMATKSTFCTDPVSYEDSIMKIAQGRDMEILGLESAKEQLSALESIPTDSMAKEVMEMISNGADSKQEYQKMIDAYKAQDIQKLYQLIMEGEYPGDATSALLDDRNKKWIGRMAGMMAGNSVFFAVGAGHLSGETGVIALLRKQGYNVVPLK